MGRGIVRLANDEYVEWSTVVDAPTTYIVGRDEAVEEWGEARVAQADERGTSFISPASTLADVIVANRAGEDEREISLDEIRERYRDEQP